ncbi:MAG: hypothetical protein JWM36_3191 [Hyphomicrobiales bacterium]|nr:hypothetical protein [Hyphomicrobiales bacterium]
MSRSRWDRQRDARLAFLIGSRWSIERIAADPIIDTSEVNVRRRACVLGLSIRGEKGIWISLPRDTAEAFGRAATRRSLTIEGMVRLFVLAGGQDAGLIDNVVDDGAPA